MLYHDEVPRLQIARTPGQPTGLHDLPDDVVRNRPVPVLPHREHRAHGVEHFHDRPPSTTYDASARTIDVTPVRR